jgi:PAS domain S-box-containing protein
LRRAAKEERDMNPTNYRSLLVAVARQRTSTGVLDTVARGLAAGDGVALVRIWRTRTGERSLHLAVSVGECADSAAYDTSEAETSAWWHSAGVQDLVRLPLLDGSETIGLLVLFRRTAASASDREWLGILAAQAAGTLLNAVAFEELQSCCAILRKENDELHERVQDLFEEAPIAYVHEGLDTRFIRANQAALKMLGVASEDVDPTFGNSFVADAPENQRRLRQAFDSVAQGKEARRVVLELRRKDNGKPVWVEWWSRPSLSGQYTRTMMVDITERVLIEQTKTALEFSLESGQVGDWDLDLIHDTSRRSLRHDQCFGYDEPIPEAE